MFEVEQIQSPVSLGPNYRADRRPRELPTRLTLPSYMTQLAEYYCGTRVRYYSFCRNCGDSASYSERTHITSQATQTHHSTTQSNQLGTVPRRSQRRTDTWQCTLDQGRPFVDGLIIARRPWHGVIDEYPASCLQACHARHAHLGLPCRNSLAAILSPLDRQTCRVLLHYWDAVGAVHTPSRPFSLPRARYLPDPARWRRLLPASTFSAPRGREVGGGAKPDEIKINKTTTTPYLHSRTRLPPLAASSYYFARVRLLVEQRRPFAPLLSLSTSHPVLSQN